VSVHGERSYGKSHTTLRDALSGGGMLTLTDGLLESPGRKSWDKSGVSPDAAGGD
jgi:C-terminal processing protease CtpA/Prc